MGEAEPAAGRRESVATRWNRCRYTAYAPIHDALVRFERERRRSIEPLALRAGERVLVVGAGTEADPPLLPADVEVLATDINRQLGDLLRASGAPLVVAHDEPALFGGMFRVVLLRRPP